MISLYNNKQNRNLKFKMNISGIESSKIQPRLIIESTVSNKAIMINGVIDENVCRFTIPELTSFEKGEKVKAYYEAIVDEEQYSKLWEDSVEIDSKTEIKISEASQEEEQKKEKFTLTSENLEPEFEDEDEDFEPLKLVNKK